MVWRARYDVDVGFWLLQDTLRHFHIESVLLYHFLVLELSARDDGLTRDVLNEEWVPRPFKRQLQIIRINRSKIPRKHILWSRVSLLKVAWWVQMKIIFLAPILQTSQHRSISEANLFPVLLSKIILLNDVKLLWERALQRLDSVKLFELLVD